MVQSDDTNDVQLLGYLPFSSKLYSDRHNDKEENEKTKQQQQQTNKKHHQQEEGEKKKPVKVSIDSSLGMVTEQRTNLLYTKSEAQDIATRNSKMHV